MKKKPIRIGILILGLLIVGALKVLTLRVESESEAPAVTEKSEPAQAPAKVAPAPDQAPPPAKAVAAPLAPETSGRSDRFSALTQRTLKSLVTQQDLRKLSEAELHTTPRVLLMSGLALGKIAEAIAQDPSLVPQAIEFYTDCAVSGDIAQTVRALCLARYQHHSGKSVPAVASSRIPESVIQLAEHVQIR